MNQASKLTFGSKSVSSRSEVLLSTTTNWGVWGLNEKSPKNFQECSDSRKSELKLPMEWFIFFPELSSRKIITATLYGKKVIGPGHVTSSNAFLAILKRYPTYYIWLPTNSTRGIECTYPQVLNRSSSRDPSICRKCHTPIVGPQWIQRRGRHTQCYHDVLELHHAAPSACHSQ